MDGGVQHPCTFAAVAGDGGDTVEAHASASARGAARRTDDVRGPCGTLGQRIPPHGGPQGGGGQPQPDLYG